MNEAQIKDLMDLGLSRLQARIYLTLLMEPALTGYKIARELNDPVANTYKALEVLLQKGIILLDETGNKRLYSALPIRNYLNQLEIQFSKRRLKIEKEFESIKPAFLPEGIFKIESIDQLFENAKTIIHDAEEILAIDSSPLPLYTLKPSLEACAKRGVRVIIKSYSDIAIRGCDIIFSSDMGSPVSEFPIQYFSLISPGKDHLSALLNIDNSKIFQAIQSKNRYLSLLAYNGIASEFALTKLLKMVFEDKSNPDILHEWTLLDPIRPGKSGALSAFFKSLKIYDSTI
jgi:sugar-specific transcriptional regulator TrmB